MRLRILLGAVLLVAGIVVPVASFSVHGEPWGYRGAQAILLEVTGDVQITGGLARAARAGSEQGVLAAAPGLRLESGDTIRVGRFSQAVLRLPNADVWLKDGGRATLGEGRIVLGRGVAEVVVKEGQRAAQIDVEGAEPGKPDAEVSVQPGRAVLTSDGRGTTVVVVREGSAQASSVHGAESAEPRHVLTIARGAKPVASPAPSELQLQVECVPATKKVVGKAPPATALYLNGKMEFPEPDGRFSFEWPPGVPTATLFARDPSGLVDRRPVSCPGL